MSEYTNPKLLAIALMCASFTSGCELIDKTLESLDINDPVQNIVQQPVYAFQPPAAEPAVPAAPEPEPTCPTLWRGVWTLCDGSTREL